MFEFEELSPFPVVTVRNLLTEDYIAALYDAIEGLKDQFDLPDWADTKNGKSTSPSRKSTLCSAQDIWLPSTKGGDNSEPQAPEIIYSLLIHYFFHQGIKDFLRGCESEVFRLLPSQSLDGRVHIITYGNDDYYNWHRDRLIGEGPMMFGSSPDRNVLYTFNLLLGEKPMTGGDLQFMRNGKTIKVPFEHNMLVIFPATMNHSVTKVTTAEEHTDLREKRMSVQFWLAGSQHFDPAELRSISWFPSS